MNFYQFSFKGDLNDNDIIAFRGAVIRAMGSHAHPLMHNHENEGFRFSYPLVQYKSVNGHPLIVAFGEVGEYLAGIFECKSEWSLQIKRAKVNYTVEDICQSDYSPSFSDQPLYYKITRYLPLTDNNVKEYESLMALTDRICLIEKILTGNMLSFFKGIGYTAESQIENVVSVIDKQDMTIYKGVRFKSFDLHFASNVLLPDFIGLGKSSSVGMGIIQKKPLPEQYIHYLS